MRDHRPIVFIGPSAARPDERLFDVRPPAAAGDLLALAHKAPRPVALIDGVFDSQAAVQHKEVLELMSRGFALYGAASMGALRAAELHQFGMNGVGAIFRAFVSGLIHADDEVALLHAPAELSYRPLTVALIDVKANLVRAMRRGVIQPEVTRSMRNIAIECFWRDRDWSTLHERWRSEMGVAEHEKFLIWLSENYISLKMMDAGACLKACRLSARVARHVMAPPRTTFFCRLAGITKIDLGDMIA